MADREEKDVAVRASDAERERAVEALRAAAGEGRLTLEELAERLDQALGARTRGELEPLTADLPAPAASPEPGREGTRWTVSVMSGNDRKGRWRIAARSTVINVMGGSDLDLTDALIDSPETVITVYSIMGGSDIIVPEGVDVQLGGFALMGGTDVKTRPRRRDAPSSGGAPALRRPR